MGQRTLSILLAAAVVGCGDGSGPGRPPRSYVMGFAAIPPRLDTAILIPAINNWALHADAAIMHVSPPWAAMIGGFSPADAVDTVEVPLANYYRARHLAVVFTVDATDGLNRAARSDPVVRQRPGRNGVGPARAGRRLSGNRAGPRRFPIRGGDRPLELPLPRRVRGPGQRAQLTFYDLDLSGWTLPPGSILPLFAHLGLADSAFNPKPALAVWDNALRRLHAP